MMLFFLCVCVCVCVHVQNADHLERRGVIHRNEETLKQIKAQLMEFS